MKRLIIGLLLAVSLGAYGQYSYRITASGASKDKGCEKSTLTNTVTVTFNGITRSISGDDNFVTGTVFSGTYSNPITAPLTVKGSFNCQCDVSPCVSSGSATFSNPTFTLPIPFGIILCEGINLPGASNSTYNVSASFNIWKSLLDTPVNISSNLAVCTGSGITLRSNDALPSYTWEVAKGAGSFFFLKTTTTNQITVTQAELAAKFSNPSGLFSFRVRNPNCVDPAVSNPISGIQFWAPAPTATAQSIPPSCVGGSDGRINITSITGFVNQYEIVLKKQAPNGSFQPEGSAIDVIQPITFPIEIGLPISAGNYMVIVANNEDPSNLGGCNVQINLTINDPPPFTILPGFSANPVSCHPNDNGAHNDGSIQLTVANGTPPYSYQANTGSGFFAITPDNPNILNPSFSGLIPATYQIKASFQNTSTGVTCESNIVSGMVIAQPVPLNLSASKTDNLCKEKDRGAINTTVSGGNGGYSFSWSASGDYAPYSIPPVEDPADLFAGNYLLTVTDAKGCSNATPLAVTITEPALPLILTASVPSQALFGGFDMTCTQDNGIIEIDAQNEALPIATYSWLKDGSPFTPSAFTFAENLTPGTYEVTVFDANNCDASQTITLNPHPGITAIATATSSFNGFNTKCPDTNEGAGEVVSVVNAFGGISYTWFDGSTNQDIFDLLPGNYAVTVIDGNGCSDVGTLVIAPPPAIQPNIQITSDFNGAAITCPGAADGAMEAFPVNGFGNYAYLWGHGPITKEITGLGQGTYTVTVTDDFGCAVTSALDINDPATMQLNFTKTSYNGSDLTCRDAADGEIQLDVLNGAAPFAYTWSEGSTTQNIAGLAPGDYAVTVTDQNNCTQVNSVTIVNPEALEVDMQHPNNFNGFDISCNGLADGAAKAFLSGGTAPYRYAWAGGQATETILGQPAGTYSVDVLDANDCPNSGSIVLTEPDVLGLATSTDVTVSCNGFSDAQVSLTGSGGAGTYSYSLNGINYQSSNVFANLNAGLHDFFIKDGNNCVMTIGETFSEPDPLDISFQNIIDATCNDPVGSAQAVATGGNGGFVFSWFDASTNQPMNDGDILVKAIAGIYRVEVSDARNCQLADLVAVSSIGGAEFDIQNIVPVTCFGFSDGSAAINVTSGIAPFSFRWSDGQTEALASKLPSGNYFATVTDGLGCNTIKPLAIPTPAPLETSFTKVLPNCVGDCDGSIEVVVGGGIMPYTTDWTGLGQQVTLVSGLCAGNYDLRITDSNNCILEQLVDLPDPEALKVNPLFTTPICMGRCDGSIEVSGQGGTGPYTFQWLNGPAAPVNSQLCPGGYDVTITDSHGCIATEQLQLADGDPLPIDLGGQATLCVGQSRLLDAGEGWASVSWSSTIGFTSTNQSILITEPAAYFLTAIDPIGCMALDTFRLATSLDLLQAEFIMPSEAIVGDTLVAIDISWPLPERVEWTVPLSFNRLPSENPDFLFVVIPQEGTYTIAMQSFLAECRDTQEKQVVVLGPNPGESGGRLGHQEQLITHFTVFPNPNDGEFDVLVQLSEEKEIALQVVSFPKGIVEARYDGAASDFHQVGFSLKDLPQGIHFILLKVGSEQRAVRFVRG